MFLYFILFYFCILIFHVLINLGIKISKARKDLKDSEKALLLSRDANNLSFNTILKELKFPSQIKASTYYRFLDFEKKDKEQELRRLKEKGFLTSQSIKVSYNSLKQDVWKPLLIQEAEKSFMEKTIWGTRIRKSAGMSCFKIVMLFYNFLVFSCVILQIF